jgi:hypothetical protein
MAGSSPSTPLPEAPPWLLAVYSARRERTMELVRMSVEALCKDGKAISISSIVATSRALDPAGQGISQSALLQNREARAHYEAHRTWSGQHPKRAPARAGDVARVKLERDLGRARQRYLRLSKRELAERLLATAQACAEYEARWLRASDECFAWMLLGTKLLSSDK